MLGFSPLSQGPIGTSGAASGNVTVTIDVQNVQATGQTQSNDFLVRIPIVIPISGWGSGAWNQGAWGTHLVLPQGTTAVGDVLVPQDSVANLTGVSATGQVGNTFETQNGVSATGSIGTPIVVINEQIILTGVSASTFVNSVLIWDNITPVPGTSWSNIVPTPSSSWSGTTPAPNTSWSDVSVNPSTSWIEITPAPNTSWTDEAA